MLPFQKLLKREKQSLEYVNSMGLTYSSLINERIDFKNGFSISIQCSFGHYCEPRKNILDPSQYQAYEIAIFYEVDPMPYSMEELFGTDWEDGYLKGYVSSEMVQHIFDCLRKLPTPISRKNTIDDLLKDTE